MRLVVILGLVAFVFVSTPAAYAADTFSAVFVDETLRVDYYHVGNKNTEIITLDRLFRQGNWAGSRTNLVDASGIGLYVVEVRDSSSNRLLFSRGFDSYFGEYQTTAAAAAGESRTYHESILTPFPRQPVRITISKRPRNAPPSEVAGFDVDPSSILVSAEPPDQAAFVFNHRVVAEPHKAVDLVIVGEGYTASDSDVFSADLERFSDTLLSFEPFASHGNAFNIRGVLPVSQQSGCDEPTHGIYRDTPLGASFNALGSPRYLLTENNRALRNVVARVPYDAIAIMVNHDRYGGGGIYNFYCVFTAHNQWSPYLLVHEFGHSFGGLADEYYTSSVAYNDFYPQGVEPIEPNITALLDPDNLKWKDLIADGTALPTPWEKAEFDAMDQQYQAQRADVNRQIADASRSGGNVEEVESLKRLEESLSRSHAERISAYLAQCRMVGKVGAFEGAGYSAQGLYRPMLNCIMFSKEMRPFCKVCERAVAARIQESIDP
jgi:hypothetical protein